jgi:uncharacterized protein YjhX (UPF0386 family)
MARQGWQLKAVNYRSFIFEKSSPADTQYRIGYIKNDEKANEKIREYEQEGWEYIPSKGNLRIFRALKASENNEPDKERKYQAGEWRLLRKDLLIQEMPLILLNFLSVALLVYRVYQWPAEAILVEIFLAALIIFLLAAGTLLSRLIAAYSNVSKLISKLEEGHSLDHGKDYKKKIFRNRAVSVGGALIVVPILVLGFGNLAFSYITSTPEVPEGADLPVLQLADIIDEDLVPYINGGEEDNFYRERWGIIVPEQYSLREVVSDPDHEWEPGNSGTSYLWSYRYTGRTEGLSGRLAQSMVEEYSRHSPLEDYEPMESTDFDDLWVSENHLMSAVIARAGREVFYVQYSGDEPVDILVDSIANKFMEQ